MVRARSLTKYVKALQARFTGTDWLLWRLREVPTRRHNYLHNDCLLHLTISYFNVQCAYILIDTAGRIESRLMISSQEHRNTHIFK